jgi:hypothetical protein
MTEHDDLNVKLDPNVLERLADIICGDDSQFYRTGYQISRLLQAAGWTWAGSVDGGRRFWVLQQLQDRRADSPAMQGLLIRLVDPREYLDDEKAREDTLAELNGLLALEGLELFYASSGPRLRRRDRHAPRPASGTPIQLTVNLADLVHDEKFGAVLARRLDEAHECWRGGATLAATIMLGSLLEGVLYDFACNHTSGKTPRDHLESLIDLARDEGWIARDVVEYAHVLRQHRNLVHPRRQHLDGHTPDDDSVRIAWNVVVAAINDLSAKN